MKTSPLSLIVATSVFAIAAFSSASAVVTAYNPDGDSTLPAATGLSGVQFEVTTTLQLTDLGFYASSIGGADTPHVTLFQVTGGVYSQILDVAIPLAGIQNNAFNYVTLETPIVLSSGTTYVVSAPAYFAPQYTSASAFTYGPELTAVTFLHNSGGWNGWANSNYDFANLAPTSTPYTTANFKYEAVPEPSTVAFLAIAGLGFVGFCSRRRFVC